MGRIVRVTRIAFCRDTINLNLLTAGARSTCVLTVQLYCSPCLILYACYVGLSVVIPVCSEGTLVNDSYVALHDTSGELTFKYSSHKLYYQLQFM